MAYNKAREEKKWKQWKENEEQQLRSLGMDEDSIAELRRQDWEDFNSERRYREHLAASVEYPPVRTVEMPELEIRGVDSLLESVENEELLHILLAADKKTLRILLLKMMGYSTGEVAEKLRMPEQTVYTRLRRLRKKIKKFHESE